MKKFFVISFLFFIGNIAFCDYSFSTATYSPKSVYYQNFPQSFSYSKRYYSPRSFNNLERRILNHNFMYETPSQRLNRMEEATFGAIQSGNEINRYRALQKVLGNNSDSKYYTPNHKALRQNFFRRTFAGMPTGFTPPVRGYDYDFPFENNYNLQSGMKFKIIDD